MKANTFTRTSSTLIPISLALSGLSPTTCTCAPKRWRLYSNAQNTTKAKAQNICTGTPNTLLENTLKAVLPASCGMAIDFDCVMIRMAPRSMKFMPRDATSDDRPP